jgi:hypothetical protein
MFARTKIAAFVLSMLCAATATQADVVSWNAGTGSWSVNTNWNPTSVPSSTDDVEINNGGTAQVSSTVSDVGTMGSQSGTLEVQTGGSLTCLGNALFGNLNGGTADITISGGTLNLKQYTDLGAVGGSSSTLTISDGNFVQNSGSSQIIRLGRYGDFVGNQSGGSFQSNQDVYISEQSTSNAVYNLSGGSFTTNQELRIGAATGTSTPGTMNISGGSVDIGTHVRIGGNGGSDSIFNVEGSAPTSINVGGNFILRGTGILQVGIDAGGVTPIQTVDVQLESASGGTATLDPTALSGAAPGTYTVLEWTGSLYDNNLVLDSAVDPSLWSFNLDETNQQLTVTYVPEPVSLAVLAIGGVGLLRRKRG